MLHPTLARALATAHIEDLQRAAARRHTIRLARRVVHEPRGEAVRSLESDPRRFSQVDSGAPRPTA